jgi:uncharacterized membrane-anchored protein
MQPKLSLALSALVFLTLVLAQAWVTGVNPGFPRLIGAALMWTFLAAIIGGMASGLGYIFDITDPVRLKRQFSKGVLVCTLAVGVWMVILLASDAPPTFDAPMRLDPTG